MFFKSGRWIFVASLLFVQACSRSLPLGEQEPARTKPTAQLGFDSACLSRSVTALGQFIQATASAPQINEAWNCFGEAVQVFRRKVVSNSSADRFSQAEVGSFFEEFFLNTDGTRRVRLSPQLLGDVFLLKQLLIGGSSSHITKDELLKLIDVFEMARNSTLRLRPYMAVYVGRWEKPRDPEAASGFFEDSRRILREEASRWGQLLDRSEQTLELARIAPFMRELEALVGTRWAWVDQLPKVTGLVGQLKIALIGGIPQGIQSPEWSAFFDLGANGVLQFLRYRYFFQQAEGKSASTWERLFVTKTLDELLDFVAQLLAKKQNGLLTDREIYNVLRALNELLPTFEVRFELITEVMALKKTFIGGYDTSWTPADIRRLQVLAPILKQAVDLVVPEIEVLTFQMPRSEPLSQSNPEQLARFEQAFEQLAKTIALLLPQLQEGYDLNRLVGLLQQWDLFRKAKPDAAWAPVLSKYLPLIERARGLAFNQSGLNLNQAQLATFLQEAQHVLKLANYFFYFTRHKAWDFGDSQISDWQLFVGQVRQTIQRALDRRDNKKISWEQWRPVIAEAELAGVLSKDLKLGENFEKFLPLVRLVSKKLVQPSARAETELDGAYLYFIERSLFSFLQSQKAITRNMRDRADRVTRSQTWSVTDQLAAPQNAEWGRILRTSQPFVFDSQFRTRIDSEILPYDLRSLTLTNLVRLATSAIFRSYGDQAGGATAEGYLTLPEAQRLYRDFEPIAIQLGWLSQSDPQFIISRFRDGNLFTPRADGDERLSYREASDLVLMLASGISASNMAEKRLRSDCRLPRQSKSVPLDCFLRNYRQVIMQDLTHLPELRGMVGRFFQEESAFLGLMRQYLVASGWKNTNAKRGPQVKFADALLVPQLMQYVEVIMQRYDTNNTWKIDRNEAMQAYPLLRPLLARVSGSNDDKILRGLLSYLLVYGRAPEQDVEKFIFVTSWINSESTWPVSADRLMIAKVLAYIAEKTSE